MTTRTRLGAAIVAVAPAVLLAGVLYHPYLSGFFDSGELAAAVESDTTRWGLAHLAVAIAYGLLAVAFVAVRSYLRKAGEHRWSNIALPFVVLGCTMFAVQAGMEFGPLAAAEAGGDVEQTQEELVPWVIPTVAIGALAFTLGILGFAKGIADTGVVSPGVAKLVVGALVVTAAVRFLPLGETLYVHGVAGVAALWPLAAAMWSRPEPHVVDEPRAAPPT
ncbi:MAG: hypothetical protein ACRDNY_04955 [Gaiellaceae bacterium]